MDIILFDINEQVIDGWKREFEAYEDDVQVVKGRLEEVPACDAIVAAGNSFGIMDGGLDAAMATQMPSSQSNVAAAVASDYMGEIPVGSAVVVPSGSERPFRWLVYTPTMRYPRPIAAEIVYDATRAALLAVRQHNAQAQIDALADLSDDQIDDGVEPEIPADVLIQSVAIPGLGTGTGNVGGFSAAKMMRLAYETILVRDVNSYTDWDEVSAHLKKIYGTHE